jgi:hypothetical protein
MKFYSIILFFLLFGLSSVVKSQNDSLKSKNHKIILPYCKSVNMFNTHRIDSAICPYVFNDDYIDFQIKPFLKGNKKAYRKLMNSFLIYDVKGLMIVSAIVNIGICDALGVYGGSFKLTTQQNNLLGITGIAGFGSLGLVWLTGRIAKKHFIKAIKIYNRDAGYPETGSVKNKIHFNGLTMDYDQQCKVIKLGLKFSF